MWVPLIVRDRAVGVIAVHDKLGADPRFTDEDLRLAEGFAVRASAAVELSERVQRDALRRVVEAQELERRRLARELHDETGQALTSILLGLKAVEEAKSAEQRDSAAADLRELVVSTLQDVRRLAVELRPTALDDFGLLPALERLAQTFTEQIGIDTDVEASLGEARLPTEVETALYRLVQEALTNVVKHSRAAHVSISLVRKASSVSAVIEDDGVGFAELSGDGLGLIGMRERVGLLDGRLEIESRPTTARRSSPRCRSDPRPDRRRPRGRPHRPPPAARRRGRHRGRRRGRQRARRGVRGALARSPTSC